MLSALRETCIETGFLVLENPFRTPRVIAAPLEQMQRFFSLPDDHPVKRAVLARSARDRGWHPLFSEPAYQEGTVAWLESFDCGALESSEALAPDTNRWPTLPGFRAAISAYWDEASAVGDTLLEALADMLGLEPRFLVERCATRDLNTLRLLSYPENEAPMDDRNVGISAHTDFECITLICQTAPGLELMDARGHWYEAPADRDALIVLFGDMLERWTNGVLPATGHRVRNTPRERHSIVLFMAANRGVVVEPLAPFVGPERAARYAPVTQEAHLALEMGRAEANRTVGTVGTGYQQINLLSK